MPEGFFDEPLRVSYPNIKKTLTNRRVKIVYCNKSGDEQDVWYSDVFSIVRGKFGHYVIPEDPETGRSILKPKGKFYQVSDNKFIYKADNAIVKFILRDKTA